jgi:hypothetical protein
VRVRPVRVRPVRVRPVRVRAVWSPASRSPAGVRPVRSPASRSPAGVRPVRSPASWSPARAESRLQGDWHVRRQHRAASAFTQAPLSPALPMNTAVGPRDQGLRRGNFNNGLDTCQHRHLETVRWCTAARLTGTVSRRADAPGSERRLRQTAELLCERLRGRLATGGFCAPTARPGFGDGAVRRPLNCRSLLNCHRALRALIMALPRASRSEARGGSAPVPNKNDPAGEAVGRRHYLSTKLLSAMSAFHVKHSPAGTPSQPG